MVTKSDSSLHHLTIFLFGIGIFGLFTLFDFSALVWEVWRFFSNPLNFTWLSVTLLFYGVLYRKVLITL